jgi:ribosome-associated toxin RatA of RatAB toxin-antitoxin module
MREGSSISMSLVDGPFRHLQGQWTFTPLGEEGSKVELHLEFDFSSKMLHSTVGPVFSHIAETMVSAFCNRAHEIYGDRDDH